jgi:hypothetical protein
MYRSSAGRASYDADWDMQELVGKFLHARIKGMRLVRRFAIFAPLEPRGFEPLSALGK